MTKTKKIMLAVTAAILVIVSICIYVRFSQALAEPEVSDGNYNIVPASAAMGDTDNLDSVFGLEQPEIDPNRFDKEYVPRKNMEYYEGADVFIDTTMLFGESPTTRDMDLGLLDSVKNFDDSALTVTFDSITFRAGMRLSEIIDNSYWYVKNREDELLEPGTAAFVTLDNDFWTNEEIRLVDRKTARNGDIIVWVHNYSSIPVKIRDCVIYKYQISYLGCWDDFSERPELRYRDFYTLGSNEFPDAAESIRTVTTDRGTCTRYTYGEISDCQVFLDADKHGLVGITVFYNEFYGPEFDERR